MPGGGLFGLTPRQMDLLRFLSDFQSRHNGASPTLEECRQHMGIVARSNMVRMLDAIEERGHIRRPHGQWRSIEILRALPVSTAPDGAPLYFIPLENLGHKGALQHA